MPIPANYTGVADRLKLAADTWTLIEVAPPVMLSESMGYVRASVTLKDGRRAFGTAHFRLGLTGPSAQAKFPIEDCETSAVGRALGFLGFGTLDHFPSREEMERVETFRQPRAQPPAPPYEEQERETLIGRLKTARAGIKRMGLVLSDLKPSMIAEWSHDKLLSETEIAEREYDTLRTPAAANAELVDVEGTPA